MTKNDEIPYCRFYVTMTDKFMSGWGKAKGKKNKLILCANNRAEAEVVARNAKDRSEMQYVKIISGLSPQGHRLRRPQSGIHPSFHGKSDYKTWYKKDRPFKKSLKHR